ncbi:transposase [Patescibacteria group bacterium]|nr:transposase [Patescibacteria group bacterium]
MIDSLWLYRYLSPPLRMSYLQRLTEKKRTDIKQSIKGEAKHVHVVSYCLMPNHFHILIKQVLDKGVSIFMSNLQNSYTRYFNTQQKRIGPIFLGKFKAVLIESEEQLLHTSRYIHLNPFSASIVKNIHELRSYSRSSLQEYIANKQYLCNIKILFDLIGSPKKHWQFISSQADYQRKLAQNKHLSIE